MYFSNIWVYAARNHTSPLIAKIRHLSMQTCVPPGTTNLRRMHICLSNLTGNVNT